VDAGAVKIGLSVVALLALAGAAAAAAAPIEGVWRTASDGGEIELHRCGEALCGRVVESDDIKTDPDLRDLTNKDPALRGRRLKGLDLFHGFRGGPDLWTNGRVYNPEDGRTYRGQMELMRDGRLKVTGCLVFPLCRSQVWTRAR
jgi:uncharacterized protein (DUF2147 family)